MSGWDVALNSMAVGEQAAFTIAPSYGYGTKGVAPVIPPNAPLFLEVTLRDLAQGRPEAPHDMHHQV